MDVDSTSSSHPTDDGSGPERGSRLLWLFSRHDRALRAYARVILPTLDDVDDVLQEASLVIWEKQDQLRNEDEFLPWAKVIVRNISFRHRRRLVRDRHVFDDELVERLLEEEDKEEVDSSGEYRALIHCLDQLPPERRELILAPYRGTGEVKQLAGRTSRSANSLYKLLQRLRVKLQHCMEERLEEEVAG